LPHVPTATLRCYGSIEDQQPSFGWLFLEDAGEERFSSSSAEHRALAARWLAVLHTSIPCQPVLEARLPGRPVEYYRGIVGLARDAIGRGRPNPALTRADAATLEAILRSCDRVESRWSTVEEICRALPCTLVHGDFGAKNVRVRADREGLCLLPLDWDSAGWGVAASDLSQADVTVYWSVARARWPALRPDALARLATVGRMFLALESITGEGDALGGDWVDDVMRKMRAYEAELAGALKAAGWGSR
jgi:aminoglycoside phosphotransferase (APT) family kinase protein